MNIKKSILLSSITLLLAVFLLPNTLPLSGNTVSEGGQYKCADCNIVIITIDTLRADHLGCYGYSRNTTPNIDRFAKESIIFENAYSPAPNTLPALRSIMTGKIISNTENKDIVS
ncbi:MAG: sulfatase-like hydrolase/transferase, partial [Spirochaetota bacterium]